MKKIFAILVLVLVASLILPACATSTPTTTAAPAPTTSAVPTPAATTTQAPKPPTTTAAPAPPPSSTAAPAETIKLKFYSNFPPSAGPNKEAEILAEIISKKTNGRVQITVYPAEQLGKNASLMDLLKNGVTDMAALGTPTFPTQFPLQNGQEIALQVLPNWDAATSARNDLFNAGYNQGFENLKLLSWNIVRPMYIWSKVKISKAEDVKGLKVRSPNPIVVKPLESFGLTAVSMGQGDVYMSLDRGVIDATVNTPENVVANKWYEKCKFGVLQPLAYGGTAMIISKDAWNKLPADIQAAFDQSIADWRTGATAFYKSAEDQAIVTMKAAGVEIYPLDPAEAARWKQLAAPVIDKWATDTEAQGLPAKAMIQKLNEISKKYQ